VHIIDKIVLSIYAISLSVISFLILLVSLGWTVPLDAFQQALGVPNGQIVIGVMSGILFIMSLRFVHVGVRRAPIHAVVHDTEMGEVRISLVAVRNLVKRVVSKVPGVKNVKAGVSLGEEGLRVALELRVGMDANVPELADKLQKAVSSYVWDVAGISVESVTVSIADVSADGNR
jgi:uncharacterized alkaline shock family protein YloU